MKKIKFTGTVESFYFIPNCDEETAILYLKVESEQKLPDGKEENISPARSERFMLSKGDMGILTKGRAIHHGDKVSVYANEKADGSVSHSVGLIEH